MTVAPITTAVTPTPTTASARAGQTAIRSMDSGVFNPPSNRITARATLPIS